jgi:hypothetical protein
MADSAPAEVQEALARRQQARADRDYDLADRLRGEIEAAGWEVVDSAQGSRLESPVTRVETYPGYSATPRRSTSANDCEFSLCVALHGWPEDVVRLLAALAAGGAAPDAEQVVVDVGETGVTPADLLPPGSEWSAGRVRVVRVGEPLGHAQAWNVAARRARGRLLVFVEPSLEFGPGVLKALAQALDDPAVGVAGPFGLGTSDMRQFEEAEGAAAVALEYLVAVRRVDQGRLGEMDIAFRYYRNLDIDYSYQVRAAGLEVRQVAVEGIVKHSHRLWESTEPEERERLSKKNFNRFLDRWGRSEPLPPAGT